MSEGKPCTGICLSKKAQEAVLVFASTLGCLSALVVMALIGMSLTGPALAFWCAFCVAVIAMTLFLVIDE